MRNPSVTIRINTSCSENMHLKVYDYKGPCPPAVLRLFWIDNGVCNETFTISEKAPSRASSRHEMEMPTQSSYGTGFWLALILQAAVSYDLCISVPNSRLLCVFRCPFIIVS